jgi:hypothetical protein
MQVTILGQAPKPRRLGKVHTQLPVARSELSLGSVSVGLARSPQSLRISLPTIHYFFSFGAFGAVHATRRRFSATSFFSIPLQLEYRVF